MADSALSYISFLIRLWHEGNGGKSPKRMMVLDPRTGERHGFVDFEELVAFLQAEMLDEVGQDKDKNTSGEKNEQFKRSNH